MKDIYRPIIESLNGNLSDQRLVNSFLELNENGTSFYQQFLNDGVPEKNIKKYNLIFLFNKRNFNLYFIIIFGQKLNLQHHPNQE